MRALAPSPRRARGFSMIELTISMAVMFVLIGIVIARVKQTSDEAVATQFAQDTQSLVARIKDRFRTELAYTSLNNTFVITERLAPGTLIGSGTNLVSPWGNITVSSVDLRGDGFNNAFRIQFPQAIPPAACYALMRALHNDVWSIRREPYDLYTGRMTAGTEDAYLRDTCLSFNQQGALTLGFE